MNKDATEGSVRVALHNMPDMAPLENASVPEAEINIQKEIDKLKQIDINGDGIVTRGEYREFKFNEIHNLVKSLEERVKKEMADKPKEAKEVREKLKDIENDNIKRIDEQLQTIKYPGLSIRHVIDGYQALDKNHDGLINKKDKSKSKIIHFPEPTDAVNPADLQRVGGAKENGK